MVAEKPALELRADTRAVTPERDRLASEVDQLQEEVAALTTTVGEAEQSRAERAEARVEAAQMEQDRLADDVRDLIAKLPAVETK